jgi:hypothetical protein
MSRFRSLPALLVVVTLFVVPTAPAAHAFALFNHSAIPAAGDSDGIRSVFRHFLHGLLTLVGHEGAGGDPNGRH